MTSQQSLSACTLISYICVVFCISAASIKIRPNACTNAVGDSGTCMFVWQCIKQEGVQLGPCVDRFLVGTCCRLPAEEDNLVPGASGVDPFSKTKPVPNATISTLPPTLMTSPTLTIGTSRPGGAPATTTTTTQQVGIIAAESVTGTGFGSPGGQWSSTVVQVFPPKPDFVPEEDSRPSVVEVAGLGSRPTSPSTSVMVGQSAEGQPASTVPPEVSTTDTPPEEDYSVCGVTSLHPKGKVVGGTHAAFGEWPWQVSVRRSSFFGFASTHRCGGAILNANWVATAAHCVDDLLKSNIRVRVGEYDFATLQEPLPHQERGLERKVVHPRYNFFTYENDLALLRLDQALVLQPHIRPICLPPDTATEKALVGVNATVTGWGRLSEGGSLPTKLQQVQVPIISNQKCQEMFQAAGRQESIPDIFLCAGYEAGGRDSCQGDSGGPLQTKGEDGRWFLAGIISWGIGCAEPNMPGVCTRITKFKSWITENIS